MNLQDIPFDNELLRYWVKAVMAVQTNEHTLPSRLKYLPFDTESHRHDALHHIAQALSRFLLFRGGVYRIGEVDILKRSSVPLYAETAPALVITQPNLHATLVAPWTASNGRSYAGGLELVLFAGDKLPHDKNRILRFRIRRTSAGKWCDLKVEAPPVIKLMTSDAGEATPEAKAALDSFLEMFITNGNLMELGKLMLAMAAEAYAPKDERSQAVAEITYLFANDDTKND